MVAWSGVRLRLPKPGRLDVHRSDEKHRRRMKARLRDVAGFVHETDVGTPLGN
jgi:hypothetical protein